MAIILPEHDLNEIIPILFSEIQKGLSRKKHPFKNVVLNTLSNDKPKARWVVARKLTPEQHFYIFTDSRSAKIEELKQNNNCSLLFYYNRQGLQIHFDCMARIHQDNQTTKTYWPGIRGSSYQNYTTSLAPGTPIDDIKKGHELMTEINAQYFTVLELYPQRINILQLNKEGHIRAEFENKSNQWVGRFLVP